MFQLASFSSTFHHLWLKMAGSSVSSDKSVNQDSKNEHEKETCRNIFQTHQSHHTSQHHIQSLFLDQPSAAVHTVRKPTFPKAFITCGLWSSVRTIAWRIKSHPFQRAYGYNICSERTSMVGLPSRGVKSGTSVRCGCWCCSSTKWYALHRSTHLQFTQMHICPINIRIPRKLRSTNVTLRLPTLLKVGRPLLTWCLYREDAEWMKEVHACAAVRIVSILSKHADVAAIIPVIKDSFCIRLFMRCCLIFELDIVLRQSGVFV